MPLDVKSEMGFALYQAQIGKRHVNTKIFKGMGDAGILEIVEDYRGDTFRAVYTVRFQSAVYVLHAFQKSPSKEVRHQSQRLISSSVGFASPNRLIRRRAEMDMIDYEESSSNVFADIGLPNAE